MNAHRYVTTHMLSACVGACLCLAACGDDSAELPADSTLPADSGPGPDVLPADAGCGDLPDPSAAWVKPYQQDIVGRLTGEAEVTPGKKLVDRYTPDNRAAARTYLGGALTAEGYTLTKDSYGTGTNVYVQLDASKTTQETIVVGAHYDSVKGGPGANDNATGVAAVTAAARYLSKVSCRSKNVIFVLFDEEEVGRLGSKSFAKLLYTTGRKIDAVHTIDQMGWDQDGDRSIEVERPDPGLMELYQKAVSLGGFSISLTKTHTGGTDHISFRPYGFKAVGLTEEYVSGDTTPYYHLPTDTYATIDFDYLASSTALVNFTLAGLMRAALP